MEPFWEITEGQHLVWSPLSPCSRSQQGHGTEDLHQNLECLEVSTYYITILKIEHSLLEGCSYLMNQEVKEVNRSQEVKEINKS